MRRTDIVIIGGGLAGSTAAAMLGRAGVEAILVDPHEAYPEDFRCEKLDATQVAVLRKTGLAARVLAVEHNENPKPFVWKADPSRVLAAIERGKQALESVH